jgi:phosphohistidine phosphatase SixA
MVNEVFAQGVQRGVLLMRHSAREYRRGIHDLENPLTDHGRGLAKKTREKFVPRH